MIAFFFVSRYRSEPDIAFSGSIVGLLLSYYVNLPAGPAIVLTLGGLYVLSMIIGPLGPVLTRLRPRWHFER